MVSTTVHRNGFRDTTAADIDAYDRRRARWASTGHAGETAGTPAIPWSQKKARSYAKPHRADFGAFVREIGFRLG